MSAPARKRIIDLSHPLTLSGFSYCTGHPMFDSERVLFLAQGEFNVSRVTFGLHTGTHLDAPPIHFIEGSATISDVDPSLLIGPAIVVDVRGKGFHATITWDDIAPQAG